MINGTTIKDTYTATVYLEEGKAATYRESPEGQYFEILHLTLDVNCDEI
jgi:hypothetical protein